MKKHYLYFNKEWFRKYQGILLFLLRCPLVRYIFRINCDKRIIAIRPNSYTIGNKDSSFTTDFRTHQKYSKRVYHAFKYVWHLFHAWDMNIANRFAPQLNLGFDFLTVYPDAHEETDTVDGSVTHSYGKGDDTWANLIAGAGSGHDDTSGNNHFVLAYSCSTTKDKWINMIRSIFLFDTSALTADATISAAVMSLDGSGKNDGSSSTPNTNVYSSAPASNDDLVNGDFDSLGTTEFATSITYADWDTAGYNDFTFNATGRAAVSKTSISKFGCRNPSYDVGATPPAWVFGASATLRCNHAETTGTGDDPKLVVTYTLPGANMTTNTKFW